MRFLHLVVTAFCLLTTVSVLYLITNESTEYSISSNIQLPGTLCLNSEINSSNETPEKYFLPLTTVTNLNHKKFLIYQCTSLWCGGLGDRFRGITNSFLLALITGRTFGIQHTVPCLLQKFLKPHRYQWIIDDQILKNAKSSKKYDLIDKQSLPSANMTAYLKEDVVYLKINGDITLNLMDQADAPSRTPWLTKFSVSDLFESVLSHLFVMTEDLQRDMTKFRQEHVGSNKTVCVQYRAGKNPTFPNDGPRHGNRYLYRVWDFLSKYNKTGHVIYIATDSEHVKNEGKSKFPDRFIDIHGKITHVDQSKDDRDCSGFRKAIMEHQFLQQCDVILLSRSGYGRTAAFLRKTSAEMFCLRGGSISMCSKQNLPIIMLN